MPLSLYFCIKHIVGWVEVTKPNKPRKLVLGFAIGRPNLQLLSFNPVLGVGKLQSHTIPCFLAVDIGLRL